MEKAEGTTKRSVDAVKRMGMRPASSWYLSVPLSWVTWYCIGVRRFFSSSWEKLTGHVFLVLRAPEEWGKDDKIHELCRSSPKPPKSSGVMNELLDPTFHQRWLQYSHVHMSVYSEQLAVTNWAVVSCLGSFWTICFLTSYVDVEILPELLYQRQNPPSLLHHANTFCATD